MKDNAPASNNFNQNRYWLLWTLGTAGGWLIAYWISIVLSGVVFGLLRIDIAAIDFTQPLPEDQALPFLLLQVANLFVIGALIGTAQWLLLRRQIPEVGRWPLFTALGGVVTLFAGELSLLLIGSGMGLLQWLILRNSVNRSGWWALGSTGAWLLAYFLGNWCAALLSQVTEAFSALMFGYALVGIIGGALTGLLLLWLLRENRVLLDGLWEEAMQAGKAKK